MQYASLAAAILTGAAAAAPAAGQAKAARGYEPTPSPAYHYPTPAYGYGYGYGSPTPTPGYYSGEYSEIDDAYPETSLETALVDTICSAYYEYEASTSDSDAYQPSGNEDSTDSCEDSCDTSDLTEASSNGNEGESESFDSTPLESLLIEVLCASWDSEDSSSYGSDETVYKLKRSARQTAKPKRGLKAKSARSASKASKLRARKAGRKGLPSYLLVGCPSITW